MKNREPPLADQLCRCLAEVLRREIADVVERTIGRRGPDLNRNGIRQEPIPCLARLHVRARLFALHPQPLDLVPGAYRVRHVGPMHDDTDSVTTGVDQRLIDEIEIPERRFASSAALEPDRRRATNMCLPACKDAIQQVYEPLCEHLGKRVSNRLSNDVAMVDEVNVRLVCELEHVARPFQDRHEGWRLREYVAKLALTLIHISEPTR